MVALGGSLATWLGFWWWTYYEVFEVHASEDDSDWNAVEFGG